MSKRQKVHSAYQRLSGVGWGQGQSWRGKYRVSIWDDENFLEMDGILVAKQCDGS